MGYRAISVTHDGQEIFLSFTDGDSSSIEGSTVHSYINQSTQKPTLTEEVKQLIQNNPYRSFNLYKVVSGRVQLRTAEELLGSTYLDVSKLKTTPSGIEDNQLSESQIVQRARDEKLARLRDIRKPLLDEVDVMVNDLVLGIRNDSADILEYRENLKSATDDYKYLNDPNKAKVAIDSVDIENFPWPAKP